MPWDKDEQKEFKKMLEATAELYGKELTTMSHVLFIRVMQAQTTFTEARKALEAHLSSGDKASSFFPKPADLLRLVHGQPDDHCERAWRDVMQAIESQGNYQSVKFKDPIINTVVQDLGGWIFLGELSYEELKFKGHEFRRLYRLYFQTKKFKAVKHLPGLAEVNNRKQAGCESFIPEPLLIGSEPPPMIGMGQDADVEKIETPMAKNNLRLLEKKVAEIGN